MIVIKTWLKRFLLWFGVLLLGVILFSGYWLLFGGGRYYFYLPHASKFANHFSDSDHSLAAARLSTRLCSVGLKPAGISRSMRIRLSKSKSGTEVAVGGDSTVTVAKVWEVTGAPVFRGADDDPQPIRNRAIQPTISLVLNTLHPPHMPATRPWTWPVTFDSS